MFGKQVTRAGSFTFGLAVRACGFDGGGEGRGALVGLTGEGRGGERLAMPWRRSCPGVSRQRERPSMVQVKGTVHSMVFGRVVLPDPTHACQR